MLGFGRSRPVEPAGRPWPGTHEHRRAVPDTEHTQVLSTDAAAKGKFASLAGRLIRSRTALIATVTVVVLAVAGVTYGYAGLSKTVTLSVDGEEQTVRVFGDTVADVLEAEGIEVSDRDVVQPSVDSSISDDTVVAVRYARQIELTVDGDTSTHWVTATSVDAALDQIGRGFENGDLSVSRSADISRGGIELDVVTAKKLTVVLAGKKAKQVQVPATTVREALGELGVELDKHDRTFPKRKAELKHGMKVVYNDFDVKKRQVEGEAYDVPAVERENDEMDKGTTEVVRKGKSGVRDATYRVVWRNGERIERKLVEQDVKRKAVARVVEVGTKEEAPVASGPVNLSGVWAQLAQCESGGNPGAVNPAGPYYGLYQFTASTWASVGGSGLPHHASPAEQTKRAKILQARSGWGQWPACASKLGLR